MDRCESLFIYPPLLKRPATWRYQPSRYSNRPDLRIFSSLKSAFKLESALTKTYCAITRDESF